MTAFEAAGAVLVALGLALFVPALSAWLQRRRVAARQRRRVDRALAFHTRPRNTGTGA